uniref:Uncharacterized protein n=1 Tax=Solanum lycopersicum TaxID=4081 RepID=A0A3Q7H2V2_SOLLC
MGFLLFPSKFSTFSFLSLDLHPSLSHAHTPSNYPYSSSLFYGDLAFLCFAASDKKCCCILNAVKRQLSI